MPLDEELLGNDLSEMWKDASRWKTGDKWRSFGWNVIEIDGHRVEQISDAIGRANQTVFECVCDCMPNIVISF
jgi:transketolase